LESELQHATTEDLIAEVCNRFDLCVFIAQRPAYMTGQTAAVHVFGTPNEPIVLRGLLHTGIDALKNRNTPPPGDPHGEYEP